MSVNDSFTLAKSTDQGSGRLPKRLKTVHVLANVSEPQSRQTSLTTQDCLSVCECW